jgi:hypothetical protein
MPDLAFELRQVALPGRVLDQDHLSLAVARGYFDTGVEVDDVLAAWRRVPVDVVLSRGLAKDNPVLGQPVDLEKRINLCPRGERRRAAPLAGQQKGALAPLGLVRII